MTEPRINRMYMEWRKEKALNEELAEVIPWIISASFGAFIVASLVLRYVSAR